MRISAGPAGSRCARKVAESPFNISFSFDISGVAAPAAETQGALEGMGDMFGLRILFSGIAQVGVSLRRPMWTGFSILDLNQGINAQNSKKAILRPASRGAGLRESCQGTIS
ncbi:hypothetical protein AFEL58S_03389 [Afipia felis]